MDEYRRQYPQLAACGLCCGLCPRFHTEGRSRCPGCSCEIFAGEGFAQKHPPCGHLSCARRHGVEYCGHCVEYPCEKMEKAVLADSFITHANMKANFEKISAAGFAAFQAELDEKAALLRELLACYNDGRRKAFFCLAVNLLELADVREALARLRGLTQPGDAAKDRARRAVETLEGVAARRGLALKLRNK